MANLFDYLDWYGDLGFDAVPFNEVDNIVLSQLAYVQLEGVFEGFELLPLTEVARRFLEVHRIVDDSAASLPAGDGANPADTDADVAGADEADADATTETTNAEVAIATETDEIATPNPESLQDTEDFPDNGPLIDSNTNLLVIAMARAGRRFGEARVGHYECVVDEARREQFAAITIELPDGSVYVSYRGTDDHVAGWIEDCDITYRIVPAQHRALSYLRRVAASTEGPLRVGGHSKGGNLAAYAAVSAVELDERIMQLWCNDSPGFEDQVVPLARFERLAERMRFFTPEYSLVGGMLTQPVEIELVLSSQRGAMQHNLFSWQVMRGAILRGESRNPSSIKAGQAFQQLLDTYDLEGRKRFLDELWQMFLDADIHRVSDVKEMDNAQLRMLVESAGALSEETRKSLQEFLLAWGRATLSGAAKQTAAQAERVLAPVSRAVGSTLIRMGRRSRSLIGTVLPSSSEGTGEDESTGEDDVDADD
jgi:hypothetical protein